MVGADQRTIRLVTDSADTVGASGVPGGSFTSVTVTEIVWSTVFTRPDPPLVARTTTSYTLLRPESCGTSKFGAVLNVSTPVDDTIENNDASAPPSIE